MTKKETILYTLKDLIEKELSQIIMDENKRHNDGIVLDNIRGVVLDSKSMPMPYVRLSIKNSEHIKKNRILRIVNYNVVVEFKLANSNDSWIKLERYIECFERILYESKYKSTLTYSCNIISSFENVVIIQICSLNNI